MTDEELQRRAVCLDCLWSASVSDCVLNPDEVPKCPRCGISVLIYPQPESRENENG